VVLSPYQILRYPFGHRVLAATFADSTAPNAYALSFRIDELCECTSEVLFRRPHGRFDAFALHLRVFGRQLIPDFWPGCHQNPTRRNGDVRGLY
jgi:hypothetical protein